MKKDLALFIQGEEGNNYRVIGEAKRYIREHHAEEGFWPGSGGGRAYTFHFSTVFEHTGMSYSEYLTWVAWNGLKLLKETHYHVYEIGQMVGYTNQYYLTGSLRR